MKIEGKERKSGSGASKVFDECMQIQYAFLHSS
jgi:hypothetical protein